jgi:hypothetical protein
MDLGAYPAVTLAKVRKLAGACREAVAEGRDPIAERQKEAEPTFGECAELFLASMEGQWRNRKHRAQWRMTLTEYAAPISGMKVSKIGTDGVPGNLASQKPAGPAQGASLRLGKPLRLPPSSVGVVLASNGCKHVEHHGVDCFGHAARELISLADTLP